MAHFNTTYLLTGGNLGDRTGNLMAANKLIEAKIGRILKASSFYETQAWGQVDQPDYINQALQVSTALSPEEVLAAIFEIEADLGRTRRNKWESRLIDIDILFYEDWILDTDDLTIPHPHLHRRNFALIPLLEIAPDLAHPVFNKTIEELYENSEDDLDVCLIDLQPAVKPE